MNRRRKLVIALGGSALAVPFAAFTQQQGRIWRVGFLTQRKVALDTDYFGAFPQGMRELGYIEGKNLVIEWRSADNKIERLPGLAAELVRRQVDVIVTSTSTATAALLNTKVTIPIVMVNNGDPVGNGFVASLGRPGGNVTGLSSVNEEVGGKHLEMLHSIAPKVSVIAVLANPASPTMVAIQKNIEYRARNAGVNVLKIEARDVQEIRDAFSRMARSSAGALIILSDGLFNENRRQIAELALKYRMPSISVIREYADVGGLMSYGPSYADSFRRAATYVDKIFKGAKPGDLPVEQPTKFELFINGKTAQALGLKIPQSLLIMADKVIE